MDENLNFENYEQLLKVLEKNASQKASLFNKKLIATEYKILGWKLPYLRDYAKQIVRENKQDIVLSNFNFTYYEEIILFDFVLSFAKIDEQERIKILDKLIAHFDNWSVVDSLCSSLKSVKKNKALYFDYIKSCLNNDHEYKVRVGIVLLMNYYLDEENLKEIMSLVAHANRSEHYYVQMAQAWFFATSFAKRFDETLNYLSKNKHLLAEKTIRKTISKCNDSFRLTPEQKAKIKEKLL